MARALNHYPLKPAHALRLCRGLVAACSSATRIICVYEHEMVSVEVMRKHPGSCKEATGTARSALSVAVWYMSSATSHKEDAGNLWYLGGGGSSVAPHREDFVSEMGSRLQTSGGLRSPQNKVYVIRLESALENSFSERSVAPFYKSRASLIRWQAGMREALRRQCGLCW